MNHTTTICRKRTKTTKTLNRLSPLISSSTLNHEPSTARSHSSFLILHSSFCLCAGRARTPLRAGEKPDTAESTADKSFPSAGHNDETAGLPAPDRTGGRRDWESRLPDGGVKPLPFPIFSPVFT
jgi:hypothetical protein